MGNFKVGDKVEIVRDINEHRKGQIKTINQIGSPSGCYDYGLKEGGYIDGENIKLVDFKPSKKQRIETLEKEVSELKLIVHELRERKPSVFATAVGQDLEAEYAEQVKGEPSTDNSVEDKQADVIEFEGQQYRKVERKVVEGDVVIMTGYTTSVVIQKGIPYKVLKDSLADSRSDEGARKVYDAHFGRTPETVDVYEPIQPVQRQTVPCSAQTDKTPNELRAEVIEKAKAFFEANGGNEFVFSVDENKRTAFCWKLVSNGCGYNTIHGLSTCHPNDVYNEHIGKAIALGRALGLDVSEFEQAVQPSEPVVGMEIQVIDVCGGVMGVDVPDEVEKHGDRFLLSRNGEGLTGGGKYSTYHPERGAKIINDTNAIYGGVE